ncbi:zinc finger CCCH domain-containing protein 30-like [Rutidosis leptorrhynchoides]|uniref:zinc finger CCCH domain-containing protein 30-like n=1 Tax=Rutidosis leptorrhynchoides TaxID=125765 RepID=UPI003A9986EA
MVMSTLTVETEDSFSSLLEYAANNDFEGFKRLIENDPSAIDEVGLWYVRKMGSKQIVLEHRTPLMVASTYGSIDVLKLIISQPKVNVNFTCGPDKCTALHCAASGGSMDSVESVKLLLSVGADPNIKDANGHRPVDVVIVPPKLSLVRASLEELLMNHVSDGSINDCNMTVSNSWSPTLSSSPNSGSSPCSPSELVSSPTLSKFNNMLMNSTEKKEYPIDPSLPDIKNSIYSTDEFRMFSFKVRPCSRAYSHDWTECPFVHPGENARRRDPRKFHYSCVPCPDFRKGTCRRGDLCEYAHGVFECWLHPAQYRTRLCKDGPSCGRRVCFFAHLPEELRPLYVSTGSAVQSPRSTAAGATVMDMLNLLPGSPSSGSVMSPSAFNQPMSPNGGPHSPVSWSQPNVPTLHLPGSNLQSSRLRSSLSARDIPLDNLSMLQDFESQQLLNDLACYSQSRSGSLSLNRPTRSKTLAPANLDDLFSAELTSSPRYSDQAASSGVFSPSHKSAVLNQFQQQQSMLSPINTNIFSPKNIDHALLQQRMSPRSMDPISPMGGARLSAFAQREMPHQQLRSLSSRDLGTNFGSNLGTNSPFRVGSPVNNTSSSWSKWGSPTGKVDWSVNADEFGKLKRSSSFEMKNNDGSDEPDVSWVQSLVKESPPEMMKDKAAAPLSVSGGAAATSGGEGLLHGGESADHSVLGAWLEQMQLDQLVA